MSSSRIAQGIAAAVLVATAIGGATMAVAQGGDGTSPEALIDRLVELEGQLPDLPPSDVVLDDDTTWGELMGDFEGAQFELEQLADDARELFVTADDAKGAVADAVSSVARSYLELERGYAALAAYKDAGIAEAVGTRDSDDVATGRDEAISLAESGLDQVLGARTRALGGYLVLRDAAEADDAEKSLFDAAYKATKRFLDEDAAMLHHLLSLPSRAVIGVVDRFDSPAPGTQARARSFTITCFDRDAYPDTYASLEEFLAATGQFAADASALDTDATDCPDLPNEAVVVPSQG